MIQPVKPEKETEMIGRRFGRLIVTSRVRDESGRALWACQCDCGNTTYATTGHLNAGTKRSCGCMRREQQKDLTGMRFGRLIVLEKTDQKNPKTRCVLWRCRCDCGKECLKPTNELNSGFATSCGCAWRPSAVQPGKRYGRLTALEPTEKRSNRAVVWKCQCDCGNTVEVRAPLLQSGQVMSCGCLKSEIDRERFRTSLTYVDDTCIEFLEKINVPTKASTTGVRGVTQRKDGRYQASLTFQKKRRYLGVFKTLEEAAKARKQAEHAVEEYLESYKAELPAAGQPLKTAV